MMKPNCERISRKAERYQWDGNNTKEIMGVLARYSMIGELFRDIHIQVYKEGSYSDTLNISDWLVIGEDERLRFYTDDKHRLMYQPINDELERLRAFAMAIFNLECSEFQKWQKKQIAEKYRIAIKDVKAHE